MENWDKIRNSNESSFKDLYFQHYENMAQLAYRYVLDTNLG